MNLSKVCILFLFCLLLFPIMVFADGSVSHSFEVQGAKMISENGYFWMEIIPYKDYGSNASFVINYPHDFSFQKMFIDNESGNATLKLELENDVLTWNMTENDIADLLFTAPNVPVENTSSPYSFTFTRLYYSDTVQPIETMVFNVQVLSLRTFNPTINPIFCELQKEVDLFKGEVNWLQSANSSNQVTIIHDPPPLELSIMIVFASYLAGCLVTYAIGTERKIKRAENRRIS